jgi:hypothetical protein
MWTVIGTTVRDDGRDHEGSTETIDDTEMASLTAVVTQKLQSLAVEDRRNWRKTIAIRTD